MVNLGADIAAYLPAMRAAAESRMTETVAVGEFTDGVAEDGAPTRVVSVERYAGIGRIRYASLSVSDATGTANPVAQQAPYLSIPHGSPRLYEGDEVLVTASTADALLVDRFYTVAGNAAAGQTTAHRYPLTEST